MSRLMKKAVLRVRTRIRQQRVVDVIVSMYHNIRAFVKYIFQKVLLRIKRLLYIFFLTIFTPYNSFSFLQRKFQWKTKILCKRKGYIGVLNAFLNCKRNINCMQSLRLSIFVMLVSALFKQLSFCKLHIFPLVLMKWLLTCNDSSLILMAPQDVLMTLCKLSPRAYSTIYL